MKQLLPILLVFLIISCNPEGQQKSEGVFPLEDSKSKITPIQVSGIYEYVYEHNTDNLIENHYLEFKNGKGFYYGTSDDFDEVREGYLPGFFTTKMDSLNIYKNILTFNLSVDDSSFYKKAITPIDQTNGNETWGIGIRNSSRKYYGVINGNAIIITAKGLDPRVFIKKIIPDNLE
jgi:hypothetical protein